MVYSKEYCKIYINKSIKSKYFEYKNDLVANKIAQFGISNILDVGCNVNCIIKDVSLRSKIENLNIDYMGIDLDPSYSDIEFLSSLNINSNLIYERSKYVVGDATNISFDDNSFDGITMLDVIEHIDNIPATIKECYRVLNNNGYLFIIIPSMYKLDLLDLDYIRKVRYSTHINKKTPYDWANDVINNAQFKLLDTLPIGLISGLSYLLWSDVDNIPKRKNIDQELEISKKSLTHRKLKDSLCINDSKFDELVLKKYYINNKFDYTSLKKFIKENLAQNDDINTLLQELSKLENTTNFKNIVQRLTKYPTSYIANSVLLVFQKTI